MKPPTFKQFLLEYDFHIPDTEYGYWIDTQGKFLPVDKMEHVRAAEKYVPDHFKQLYIFSTPYEIALRLGWVRVYETTFSSGKVQIGVEFTKLKPITHAAIRYYLQSLRDKYFNKEVEVVVSQDRQSERYDTIQRAIAGMARFNT